jgi:hypothetical protein
MKRFLPSDPWKRAADRFPGGGETKPYVLRQRCTGLGLQVLEKLRSGFEARDEQSDPMRL